VNSELRRRLMRRWDKLTDGDLDQVDGEAPRLLALLREKYGYGQRAAERELLHVLDESVARSRNARPDRGVRWAGQVERADLASGAPGAP